MANLKARFDPEAHLTKQGWKGKGTALKTGQATRPLAVVRKKSLSGIGKDRDEAVPFWDNIFAATAASIMSSSNPSTGTSTPVGTPLTSSPALEGAPTAPIFLSASARMSREVARRGLYSRFFKGSIVPPSEVVEVEASQEVRVASEPGPSTPHFEGASWSQSVQVARDITRKRKEREKETKEERRARRAEKAKRKVAKSEKRTVKAGKNAAKVLSGSSEELPSAEESGRNERGGKKLELLA